MFDGAASTLTGLYEDALTDSVTVLRLASSGLDDFGEPALPTWDALADLAAWVRAGSADDNRDGVEAPFRTKVAHVAADSDVEDTDRILYEGRTYLIAAVELIRAGSVDHRKRIIMEVAD